MIKKLKIGLLSLAALSLLVGNVASATVTYSVDTTVDLSSPDINLTILATSVATSTVVGTGTFTVTVPSGSTFKVTSATRALTSDTTSTSAFIISQSCDSALLETTTIVGVSSSGTVVFTPAPNQCVYSPGGGGQSSSSSTTTTTPAVTVVAAVPATPAVPATQVEGCVAGNLFSATSGKSCTVSATPAVPATPATPAVPSSSASTASYNFGTTTLKDGSKGEAVKELQRFLNAKLNLGLSVDGALGPKTIAVIKQWQSDNGLVADGLIGPATKGMMNAQAATSGITTAMTKTSYDFGTATLKDGSKGEAVKELQRFLNAKLALSLAVDGALGPKTIAVIKQWQSDNGLVADGLIGPATKAMMNAQAQ
ncbi:hypothetical protein A3A05_03560 [Candidatus Nomurabacteria bacterium RIFCSPLOWO2_01_FULL_41_12]|uniref:Peptidoglycan binding-like domain-containing protein n=1 Tax=Candidatus Nomurabacteria bacterium RIFCSPLOWO2_01_FULL_41_12 TaxID=1801774 RepID=A0A1F6WV31_9BACT|nr:MAG: hypothetical protein A3A05_03560 [Candidatus Nomurabacteria bacterium RIFCSPLOWO2_01_FULL_41_12]